MWTGAGRGMASPPACRTKSLPHRPLIVKRLSRHKRREYIALADPRDEKEESFTKAALYTNILVTNQENNIFVLKKDCFPETTQKCIPYCNRTTPYGYIFWLNALKSLRKVHTQPCFTTCFLETASKCAVN